MAVPPTTAVATVTASSALGDSLPPAGCDLAHPAGVYGGRAEAQSEPTGGELPNIDSFHKVTAWQHLLSAPEGNGSRDELGCPPGVLSAADGSALRQQQPPTTDVAPSGPQPLQRVVERKPPTANVPTPGAQPLLQAVEQQAPPMSLMRDTLRVPASQPPPPLVAASPGQVPTGPRRFQRCFSQPSVGAPAAQEQMQQLTAKVPPSEPPQPCPSEPRPTTASRQLQINTSAPQPPSQPQPLQQPWRLHLVNPAAAAAAAAVAAGADGGNRPVALAVPPEPAAGSDVTRGGKGSFASEVENMLKRGARSITTLEKGDPRANMMDRSVSLPRSNAVAAADRVALGLSAQPQPDGEALDRVARRQSARLGTSWQPPRGISRNGSIRAEQSGANMGKGLVRNGSIGVAVAPAASAALLPVGARAVMVPRRSAPGTVQAAWAEQGDKAIQPPRRASQGGDGDASLISVDLKVSRGKGVRLLPPKTSLSTDGSSSSLASAHVALPKPLLLASRPVSAFPSSRASVSLATAATLPPRPPYVLNLGVPPV